MGCPVAGCDNPSNARYTWGLYPNGEHNKQVALCKKCADQLWEEINPSVKALLMHFVIEPLESVMSDKPLDQAKIASILGSDYVSLEKPESNFITYDEFSKVDLRVATIIAAEAVAKADKLVKLTVDAGDAEPRTIVAGIRLDYSPENLVGKQIVIVANLEPRKLKGIESHGMLLAAKDDLGLSLLTVDKLTKAGTKVG
jgi:methionyl-tRNA synthetase